MKKLATVQVTRVSDGQVRAFDDTWDNEEGFADFIWSEGNYSCDCNRALFFARAGGELEPDDAALPCGYERFKVRIIVDGKVVYEDEP